MPAEMLLNIPFERVDRDKREIWGWASTEQLASDGRIIGFEANCDAFAEWIQRGNVREQHQSKAVAKAFAYQPDPATRRILVGTRVSRSRDGEDVLIKAEEGILRGFSVRGTIRSAEQRIVRDGTVQRSVPYVTKYKIQELSYVDAMSDPGAEFTEIIRADGALLDDGALDVPEDLTAEIARADNHEPMTGKHSHGHPAYGAQGDDASHEHAHSHSGDANHEPGDGHSHAAATGDGDGDADDEVERAADISAEERRALAAKGQALSDGSYPIPDKAHLESAITLAQSGHGDVAAAKALIKRRAKALDAEDLLPESWADGEGEKEMKRSGDAQPTTPTVGAEASPALHLPGDNPAANLEAITRPTTQADLTRAEEAPAAADDAVSTAADSAEGAAGEMADMQMAAQAAELIKKLIARETAEASDPDNGADESWGLKMLADALQNISCFISGEASEMAQMMRSNQEAEMQRSEELSTQVTELAGRVKTLEERGNEIERSNPIGALADEVHGLIERVETIENSEAPSTVVSRATPAMKILLDLAGGGEGRTPEEIERALDVTRDEFEQQGLGAQFERVRAMAAMREVHAQGPRTFRPYTPGQAV